MFDSSADATSWLGDLKCCLAPVGDKSWLFCNLPQCNYLLVLVKLFSVLPLISLLLIQMCCIILFLNIFYIILEESVVVHEKLCK